MSIFFHFNSIETTLTRKDDQIIGQMNVGAKGNHKRRKKTHMERDDDIDFRGPESGCPPPLSPAIFFFKLDVELVNDNELLLDEDPPP